MSEFELNIIERLTRMETKLDGMAHQLNTHDDRIKSLEAGAGANPDHESRIRKLERAIWIAAGAAAAGGGVIGNIIGQVTGG